jgi:hypothetical protein
MNDARILITTASDQRQAQCLISFGLYGALETPTSFAERPLTAREWAVAADTLREHADFVEIGPECKAS